MRPPPARVIFCASELTKIPIEILKKDNRSTHIVMTRYAICVVCRELGYSYGQIAHSLGGRDHSSIIHSVRRAAELEKKDPAFALFVKKLRLLEVNEPLKYIANNVLSAWKPPEKKVPLHTTTSIPRNIREYMNKEEQMIDRKIVRGSAILAKKLNAQGGHNRSFNPIK